MSSTSERRGKGFLSWSAVVLIIANLVPLYGAIFRGWNVFDIVVVYWIENLVIGLINIPRILTATSETKGASSWGGKIFLSSFFMIHYGGFCLGHGFFLISIFGNDLEKTLTETSIRSMGIAIVALLLSHLFSFFKNYLGRGEYKQTTPGEQLFAPYGRIVLLHIAIILGGMGVERAGEPIILLIILVLGKIVIDLLLHISSHLKRSDFRAKPLS
jgi:hypothetical protein